MIRIALCDDMPVHTSLILMLLDAYQKRRPGIKLHTYSFDSGDKLLESIHEGQCFDIYLLDILMPELDGIMLAQQIRLYDADTPMIFLTQSASYALDAFGVSAVQYILKPINPRDLYPILDKVIASQYRDKDTIMTVSSPGRTVTLIYSSIIVIEYVGRSLHFHLSTGEIVESKTIRTSFAVAVSELLKDNRFLCVHQSFVINMDFVRELRRRSFLMRNGMDISIPRLKYSDVKKAYVNYLEEKDWL